MFAKFKNSEEQWHEFINISFLPDDMKISFHDLVMRNSRYIISDRTNIPSRHFSVAPLSRKGSVTTEVSGQSLQHRRKEKPFAIRQGLL